MGKPLLSDVERYVVRPHSVLDRADDLYDRLEEYATEHNKMTYSEFESIILKDICLFNVPDNEYMKEVEAMLDEMIRILPAVKRIFAHPIVHLKDHREIVPIEAVKVIDNQSLTHIGSRSELWENFTEESIKPRKLLTLEHNETFAIYENIAFAYAVDSMLSYIKRTLVRLKDIVYGCRDIHFNLLDREHHNLYFLAIGKLYLEYANTRSEQVNGARCVEKMMFIDKSLRQKLKSPVYVHCKRRSYNLKIKKTNIFRSHKDYSEIYHILKLFDSGEGRIIDESVNPDSEDLSYQTFCKLLTVFAIGHFNYTFSCDSVMDILRFCVEVRYKGWCLRVRDIYDCGIGALVFTTKKDKEYTTCMIFSEEDISSTFFDSFKARNPADEYLTCSSNTHGDRRSVYLSIYDIDSFRRIQQILLRGMIWSDTERTECAFCGGTLHKENDKHVCYSCGAEIREERCTNSGRKYYVSDIIRSKSLDEGRNSAERKFLHDRLEEAQLHFRNITHITSDRTPICPYCNAPHTEEEYNG